MEKCPVCSKGTLALSRYCGVKVCDRCDYHKGLVRCYCGYAADGGNGRQQLAEMGENIEEEEGY